MHLVDDFQQMKNMFVEKYVLLGLFCFVFPLCIWKDFKTFGIRLRFNQSCYYQYCQGNLFDFAIDEIVICLRRHVISFVGEAFLFSSQILQPFFFFSISDDRFALYIHCCFRTMVICTVSVSLPEPNGFRRRTVCSALLTTCVRYIDPDSPRAVRDQLGTRGAKLIRHSC